MEIYARCFWRVMIIVGRFEAGFAAQITKLPSGMEFQLDRRGY